MKTIAILDTETSGLDAKTDELLEVGVVLWSVQHRCVIGAHSWLNANATANAAEAVNGIPRAVLDDGTGRGQIRTKLVEHTCEAEAIVAHNADFDRQWLPELQNDRWICSANDLEYPRPTTSRSLIALCLAHGVGVSSAHRALTDCLLVAHLLERVAELGADVEAMLERGLRPKAKYAALVSYDDREKAKAAGFHWDGSAKLWLRTMAIEDAEKLPFAVREVRA